MAWYQSKRTLYSTYRRYCLFCHTGGNGSVWSVRTFGSSRDNGGVLLNGRTLVDAQTYYSLIGNSSGLPQYYTYSATNVRLQEASVGYTIPRKWLGGVCDINVSVVGRNLWMIYCRAPFDPEAVANTGNYYQGIDNFMLPSTRNIGVNVKINF